ncbi:MAG: hypothetical protein AB1342_15190 [Pseudomonadota bacterium]
MSFSNSGWGSDYDRDLANRQTTDEFEFNQSGKPAKAVIGIGLLVAFAVALAYFHPADRRVSTDPSPMASDTARAGDSLNSAPGQTTGSAPSVPSSSAK